MKKEGTEDDLHKSKGSRACLTACLAALVRPWIMLQPPLPKSMCVPRCCSLPLLYCCCCLKCSVAVAVAIIKNVHFAFAAGALKSLAATKWKQSIITVQRRRLRGGKEGGTECWAGWEIEYWALRSGANKSTGSWGAARLARGTVAEPVVAPKLCLPNCQVQEIDFWPQFETH